MPTTPAERLNEALTIFQAFGPERGIPVITRWKEAFPGESEATLKEWEALFRAAEAFAYAVAERSHRGELDARESCRLIGREFSWLDDAHIDRLYSQAMVYVLR
jgi:hypothetical protein